jgi:AcrR family transcriptional regulator
MGLSTELVVAEATAQVDRNGFASLSLSSLAQSLGVRVPSLYKHIEGIEGLRQRISDRAKAELWHRVETAAGDKHGIEAFRAIAITFRDYAVECPGRFEAAAYNVQLDLEPPGGGPLERVAQECGVPDEHAVRVVQAIRASLRGWLSLHIETSTEVSDIGYATLLDLLEAGMVNFDSYTAARV